MGIDSVPLFSQAKQAAAQRYQFAVSKGAKFIPTPDGRSFYLLWTPKGYDSARRRPMIVTLHGHGSWAFDEFFLWQSYAEKRGYGIVALQWWFGGGEATNDYYTPQQMYPLFQQVLADQKVKTGHAVLHGFSRGSANTYALTALDRANDRLFGLTIANSGGMAKDYPPNSAILSGAFGSKPFQGSHWVMYCGEKDANPDRDGVAAMRAARSTVTDKGGTVDLLIEDPAGDHGGFHRNRGNVDKALRVFDQLLGR